MRFVTDRFNYLFGSTKGLVLVGISLVALVAAIFGTLSGPMIEWGVKDAVVRLLGMKLLEAEREGRIFMLYHTIAMAVVAIETYLITATIPMKKDEQTRINGTITVGYITSLVCGLLFAYWGRNWIFHGLFLFGQSLIFFAGVMLAAALWPWKSEFRNQDPERAHLRGLDLELTAFFTMAIAMLGSALFGAVAGSYFGNGFESFLAENVVREPHKTALELAVIGHLHIMLTLIGIALALIIGRWFGFKGLLHKIAMPLMILGTIIVTVGVWAVVPVEEIAHYIIYAGSVGVLVAALCLVIFGWQKIIRERLAEQNIKKANVLQALLALLHDPVRFGTLWQMVYMNFVTSFMGIFMAIRLDAIIRKWPAREERIELAGHWHTLSAIMATIILLYYADMVGLKGKARQWFGWLVILGSNVAFFAVALFETKRLYVSESAQQPLVNFVMALTDIGLGVLLVVLALFLLWHLVDLFKKDGRWSGEVSQAEQPEGATEVRR